MAFEKLKAIAEDILNLEVATLTSSAGISLEPELTPADSQALESLRQAVLSAQQAVTQAAGDTAITAAKAALDNANQALADRRQALGVFEPKNTFAKIQAKLGTSPDIQVVAYSRLEVGGDSVNYISNEAALQPLIASHKELVAASQQSRQALFDFVKKL